MMKEKFRNTKHKSDNNNNPIRFENSVQEHKQQKVQGKKVIKRLKSQIKELKLEADLTLNDTRINFYTKPISAESLNSDINKTLGHFTTITSIDINNVHYSTSDALNALLDTVEKLVD